MGENKALLPLAGQPLWRRQWQLLRDATQSDPVVSLRTGDDWTNDPSLIRVFDDGSKGPMGGILAGFEKTSATHLIVLAVDLPQLPVEWLNRLVRLCALDQGAIGKHPDGSFEPLAAIYPRTLFFRLRDAAGRGEFSLQRLATRAVTENQLRAVTISAERLPWFQNWNEPSDLPPGIAQ